MDKIKDNKNPRYIALEALYQIEEQGGYSNITLKKILNTYRVSDLDKALITELVYGSIRWKYTIDWVLNKYVNKGLDKTDPWIRNILRIGVYQLKFLDKIPPFAACNESVKLTKKINSKAAGFVNAVLRTIIREKGKLKLPSKQANPVEYLSVKHSFEPWMIKRWVERYGWEFTRMLCTALNKKPDLCLRTNTLKLDKDELKRIMLSKGFKVKDGIFIPEALYLYNSGNIQTDESYLKGYFQPQDEGSMLVSHVLNPQPQELVVDVCSAPGGKTTHIAQLMRNKGRIISRDIYKHKIKLIDNVCSRMGITIVTPEIFDGLKLDKNLVGKADRVLVDAPCSGFGIIRRKPDIKWAKTPESLKQLPPIQYKLLNNASKYLKPGGILVYSTCTFEPEENQGVVMKFLKQNHEFKLDSNYPHFVKNVVDNKKGYIQIFPNTHKTDGFFIARLKRCSK